MTKNAIILHLDDNVATVLEKFEEGAQIEIERRNSITEKIIATKKIPFLHKIALVDIPKGAPVIKYGQIIGKATMDIKKGDHVHTKNLVSWFYS
jgi:altronate dehydratase small subunit